MKETQKQFDALYNLSLLLYSKVVGVDKKAEVNRLKDIIYPVLYITLPLGNIRLLGKEVVNKAIAVDISDLMNLPFNGNHKMKFNDLPIELRNRVLKIFEKKNEERY